MVLGVAAGALLALSLPKPDLYPLAWVALVPLLAAVAGAASKLEAFISSYAAGFVFFAGSCYWITETMIVYGGLHPAAAFGVGLLFAFIHAWYFAAFGMALYFSIRKWGPAGLLLAAPIWVTVELIRTYIIFGGFPWMLLGYALVPYSGLLQIVTWTGVYGLSFMAALVNGIFAFGLLQRQARWIGAAAAAVAVAWVFPAPGDSASGENIDVRIVQANIPLDQSWDAQAAGELMDELYALSTQGPRPELIVWPETPAPFYLDEHDPFLAWVQQTVRTTGAHLLLGHVGDLGESLSNSASVIAPSGEFVSRYDKMRLVPFGEYVPMQDVLFFAEKLVREVGNFTPGTRYAITPLGDRRLSTTICYESIFPDLVRRFVKQGSELIVIITNDGWFGESSAPYQHLRMGIVRAVENRRYVVRTANTGISAIIDPYGRVLASTPLGVRTAMDGVAQFRSERTFYTEYGDVFAYLNAIVVLAGAPLILRQSGKRKQKEKKRHV